MYFCIWTFQSRKNFPADADILFADCSTLGQENFEVFKDFTGCERLEIWGVFHQMMQRSESAETYRVI